MIARKDILGVDRKTTPSCFTQGWENKIEDESYMSADYLVQKIVNAVAIDGPGIEMNYEAHKIILSNEIMIIENLCNVY